jgi:hypothetical protein
VAAVLKDRNVNSFAPLSDKGMLYMEGSDDDDDDDEDGAEAESIGSSSPLEKISEYVVSNI